MAKRIISAIAVTPIPFYAGNPAGTPIAKAAIPVSTGSFNGTLTITGPNKADFQPPALNPDGTYTLKSTITIPATWVPWINLVAWQNGIANSPYTGGPYTFGADPLPSPPPPPPPLSVGMQQMNEITMTLQEQPDHPGSFFN